MPPKELTFINLSAPQQLDESRKRIRSRAAASGWKARGTRVAATNVFQQQPSRQAPRVPEGPATSHGDVYESNYTGSDCRLPDPLYLAAGGIDPFHTYPVPFQPWMPWMLNYCEFIRSTCKA